LLFKLPCFGLALKKIFNELQDGKSCLGEITAFIAKYNKELKTYQYRIIL
jgi:hypothetical protein